MPKRLSEEKAAELFAKMRLQEWNDALSRELKRASETGAKEITIPHIEFGPMRVPARTTVDDPQA